MDKSIALKITKNFSSLIIAQVVYRILSFIMMIVMARFLGVEGFGKFSYAFSFVWIFLFLSDFGLCELFIRDVAADRTLLGRYVSNIIPLKIFIGLFIYLIIIISAWKFSFGTDKFWMILILGASVIIDSFMYFFRSPFRIRETMGYEAILMVIEGILKIGIVLFVIKFFAVFSRVIIASFAFLGVSLINLAINLAVFALNQKKFVFSIDKTFWLYLMKSAYPFALIYILGLINFKIDVIMLSFMKGDIVVGWYNACLKLLEQFFIIPTMLSCVCLPLFSRLHNLGQDIQLIFKKTILVLFFMSGAVVVLCFFWGSDAVRIVYGAAFIDTARYIFILSIVLVPFFIKSIIEKVLYARGQQKIVSFVYFLGVLINIGLNLASIPRWGLNGASISTIISETLIVLGCFFVYYKRGKTLVFSRPKPAFDVNDSLLLEESKY